MEMFSIIGMILAIALLSFMVMKGANIFVAALCSAAVVALTGQLSITQAFQSDYMGGVANFIGSNFLIFTAGALMGEVYNKTNGAKSVARMILNLIGAKGSLVALSIATGLLIYGGVIGYVVIFAVYPIALEVFRQANMPRRFIPVLLVFGTCTFSGIAPGVPSGSNVILANSLGTTLMSGTIVGAIAAAMNLVGGCIMLNYMVKKAMAAGETFIVKETDRFDDDAVCPPGIVALIPLIFTVLSINVKINGKTILPAWLGVLAGACVALVLMYKYKTPDAKVLDIAAVGVKNSISSTMNTAAVVGFGSVIKSAAGFPAVCSMMENVPGSPMIAISVAATVLAGVCGSATGGLGIAAPILKPIFVDGMGVNINTLHRMALVASSGLDTLPHNGFVVTVIEGLCGETHKDSYMPIFWITVVLTIVVTAVCAVIYTFFPNLP